MMLPPRWTLYLGAVILAELALPYAPVATALLDATVLVIGLSHFGWAQRSPIALGDPGIRLLPVVALCALARILSLTMPLPGEPPEYWLVLTGVPLLLAVLAAARLTHMDVDQVAITRVSVDWVSFAIVLVSVPCGVVLGLLSPQVLESERGSPLAAALLGGALVVGAAIPEELVFRGLLQPLLADVLGRGAPLLTSLVFATTYVGSRSPAIVGLMALIGLIYGWELSRSRSLWAPLVGHSMLLLAGVYLAPLLLDPSLA